MNRLATATVLLVSIVIAHSPLVLAQDLKKLQCPCGFFVNESHKLEDDRTTKRYNTCLTVVPITATENFTLDGIKEACKRIRASPATIPKVIYEDHIQRIEGGDEGVIGWDMNTLFLVALDDDTQDEKYHCTYLFQDPDDSSKTKIEELKACDELLTNTFLEMVLCETKPWVNGSSNCSCPCGFRLDRDYSCVGGIAACDPIANHSAMHTFCYSINSTVAFPVRFYNTTDDPEPPPQWPNMTVFFLGNPYTTNEDGTPIAPMCAYKDAYNAGMTVAMNCDEIFNYTDLFGVMCYGYMAQLYGTCPRMRGPRCSAEGIMTLEWITVLLIVASFLIAVIASDFGLMA